MEEIIEICKYLSKLTHINKAYFLIVIELLVTYFIIKVNIQSINNYSNLSICSKIIR